MRACVSCCVCVCVCVVLSEVCVCARRCYLVVGDGEAEGRELPLLGVSEVLALGSRLAIQHQVLVLAAVFALATHRLLVLAAAAPPPGVHSAAQVLRRLQVVLEHRTLVVLHARTVHLVFTAADRGGLAEIKYPLCIRSLKYIYANSLKAKWLYLPSRQLCVAID